jgi:hypothetical protein
MESKEQIGLAVSGVAIAITLLVPWASSAGVSQAWVGTLFGRFVLLAALVGAVQLGPMPALFTLLAIFTLLIERSHEVLTGLPGTAAMPSTASAPVGAAQELVPPKDSHVFDSVGEPEFPTPVGDFHDSNPRLESGPQNSKQAVEFYEQKNLA